MFIEDKSKYGFEETVAKFKEETEKQTWNISAIHDLKETLKKHGKEVLPVKVFAICHPKHSGKILERDDERIISSMMPCRVSIYEKSNGYVYISRMNSAVMASAFGGLVGEVMTGAANDVEKIIAKVLE